MAKSTQLTSRQAAIVAFIKTTIEAEQRPPTFREIMKQFQFRSTNSVSNHLHALERRGIISLDDGIKLVGYYRCRLEVTGPGSSGVPEPGPV